MGERKKSRCAWRAKFSWVGLDLRQMSRGVNARDRQEERCRLREA